MGRIYFHSRRRRENRSVPIFILLAWAAGAHADVNDPVPLDVHRPDVIEFIQQMHDRNGFDVATLTAEFADVRIQPSTLEAMSRPAEKALPWYDYRARFITEQRIQEGTASGRRTANSSTAPRLARRPRRNRARYPRRRNELRPHHGQVPRDRFARDARLRLSGALQLFPQRLEQLLLLSREEAIDPRTVVGSYAGAMGARNHAVELSPLRGRCHGRRASRPVERLGRCFREHCQLSRAHGWASGEPVLAEAGIDQAHAHDLDTRRSSSIRPWPRLHDKGVRFDTTLAPDAPAMLLAAEQPQASRFASASAISTRSRATTAARSIP